MLLFGQLTEDLLFNFKSRGRVLFMNIMLYPIFTMQSIVNTLHFSTAETETLICIRGTESLILSIPCAIIVLVVTFKRRFHQVPDTHDHAIGNRSWSLHSHCLICQERFEMRMSGWYRQAQHLSCNSSLACESCLSWLLICFTPRLCEN